MIADGKNIDQSVQFLRGVGPGRAKLFAKLGITTVRDLLYHFPSRYEQRGGIRKIGKLEPGLVQSFEGGVRESRVSYLGRRRRVFEVTFVDDTGSLLCRWFNFSSAGLQKKFSPGARFLVTGNVTRARNGAFVIAHPEIASLEESRATFEELEHDKIMPVYPLTTGLNQKAVVAALRQALGFANELIDPLPPDIIKRENFLSLGQAVRLIHNPPPDANIEDLNLCKTRFQQRLIFDEFFMLQMALALKRKKERRVIENSAMKIDDSLMRKIELIFPFELTSAQKKVIKEIASDMESSVPMQRLLQGDVGSGKTAVALCACLIAVRNKKQAAIMAPTEILAVQHFEGIKKYLKDTKVSLSLLTATSANRDEEQSAIEKGERHIIIGTHALIAGKVRFHDLGLSVIDEQHRFGVKQRSRLSEMGEAVNRLIMTATPIPRTLAMTLYGDLDVSTLDEKPPGRGKIITRLFSPGGRLEALSIIRAEVEKGRQAFIIYPLIEESEKIELRAVKKMYEVLSNNELAGLRIGMVHGKMKGIEKEKIMADFTDGRLDVLLATTVIEVGIDQPNATVMMIEHAERFGLSQLHQLRGRVGRAGHDGFALLVAGEKTGKIAKERLKMMERFDDGFKLANADMSIRGSGDFFGSKQSGLPGFKIADLVRDFKILAKARQEAIEIAKVDPELALKEQTALRSAIIGETMVDFSLGDVG